MALLTSIGCLLYTRNCVAAGHLNRLVLALVFLQMP